MQTQMQGVVYICIYVYASAASALGSDLVQCEQQQQGDECAEWQSTSRKAGGDKEAGSGT
jgi:hypothetical protein